MTYKTDEKKLARWILTRAEELDIISLDESATVIPPPQPVSSKSKKRKGKGRKAEPTPTPLPTDLKAGQMARLAARM